MAEIKSDDIGGPSTISYEWETSSNGRPFTYVLSGRCYEKNWHLCLSKEGVKALIGLLIRSL